MPKDTDRWTNKSVATLETNDDPIAHIVKRAQQVTLDAMADGWSGPPFDPIELAARLKIDVEPREDIPDARTVPVADGQIKIEFNPNRPRGRIRYSIAHEIAHTFFPDCADRIRNREQKEEIRGDEWQLEMLCNIAAAELIMPIGSFPDLREKRVSIDELMEIRRQYDVSIEALLLRFIRLTRTPCVLFAASRAEQGSYDGRYRIDYVVPSTSWTQAIQVGSYLREGTILEECTAIGFTAKGEEVWHANHRLHVECVGTPPYPGRMFPRVLGLLSDPSDTVSSTKTIVYLHGDALQPRGNGPKLIAHVVNDRSQTWGGGFAKQVAIKYSPAQVDFRVWAKTSGNQQLGNTHFYGEDQIVVASMVAQQGFGASETPRIRYPALEQCLAAIRARAQQMGASVHMPRIGCGQAGGKWEVVAELIEREIVAHSVPVTIYDLPPGSGRKK